ncbi:hypothetical protein HBA55_36415 [Pseudomaricurvus alkylphenolicus]|uniref:hypothetical protein n=1 Tax=Pseudomaricurvus alkylphenolicus TaxID=1306991 RepID=UPI00142326BD|nr:hypothetical protein [Pseudomaricurvus alkylphenolicus]NIB45120.1 hypothetical protein [Pseudomaricurvus alkylphenolicus]
MHKEAIAVATKFILALTILSASNAQSTPLHTGHILVKLGGIEEIKREVIDHSKITRHEKPVTINVHLWDTDDGIYVYFPDGTTTYSFINLISWLNYPPGKEHIGYSKGWLNVSSERNSYFLVPDVENQRGDTLLGADVESRAIRVYLPEARISPASKKVQYERPPALLKKLDAPDLAFEINIDIDPSFGNPGFFITDPMDSNWGY